MKLLKNTLALLLCLTLFTTLFSMEIVKGETVENTTAVEFDEDVIKAVEKKIDNPEKTADIINEIEDTDTYKEAVRTALDEYYKNSDEESIDALTSSLDERGDEIAENYENAEEERQKDNDDLGFMAGEILAVTKSGVSEEEIPSIITDDRMGVVCTEDYGNNRKLLKISISYEDTVDRAIDKLKNNKKIDFVQKNITYKTSDIFAEELSDDFYTDRLFHLNGIKAPDAWDFIQGVPHEKIKVGIIDTGAQIDHPDLKNIINKDLSVRITSDGIYAPLKRDNGSHGTHVSGIVAGEANNKVGVAGVASAVKNDIVDLVEIGSDTGTGSSLSCFVIYKAILYAIDNDIRVINMSLGGYTDPDNIFQDAIDLAVNSGCVVVCAAGNENSSDNHYPSDCHGAISVIALDTDCKSRASYSNYGGTSNKISAPGTQIISSVPENSPVYNYSKGYEAYSGTSMATPVVAGTVAMMLSVNPKLTNSKIKEMLYSTADDLGRKGYDTETGYGRVNVYEAVKASFNEDSSEMPTAISLSSSMISVKKGASTTLKASVTAKGDYSKVYFHCDNTGIAKIDQNGKITGVAVGETTVTACTENTISTKCKVVVTSTNSSSLAVPKTKAVQTGSYTGARFSWEGVESADYYQLYASSEKNGEYKYIGSTRITSYAVSLGYGGEEVPASNVTFYKIRAVSGSAGVKDSDLSSPTAYVYIGQNPDLTVDQIYDRGYDKGMFIHWGAITESYLYRTDNTTGKKILLEKFPENYLTHFFYDTTLTVGHNYTYELKLFTEYEGTEYSEVEDTVTFDYLDDDPVDESFPECEISGANYNKNTYKLILDHKSFRDYGVNIFMASDDNGRTWYRASQGITNNDGYIDTQMTEETFEDGKSYLFRYKVFVKELFGTYRTASKYSNTVKVTLPEKLNTPKPTVLYTDGKAELKWDKIPDADYYTVYRKDIGTGKWKEVGENITETSFTDYTVKEKGIYYYKVNATNTNPDFKAYDITNNKSLPVKINPQVSDDSETVTLNTGVHNTYIYFADVDKIPVQNYTGEEIQPLLSVNLKGKTLYEGYDYALEYINNVNAGTAYAKLVGVGEYTGTMVVPFTIKNPDDDKTFTVTYKDNEGKVITVQKVKYGEKPEEVSPPYKDGYKFLSWDTKPESITADTVITAIFKEVSKLWKVKYLDKDGNVIKTEGVYDGESSTPPEIPYYEGYEFTSWDTDYKTITHNTVVKARYKAIAFEGGKGTESSPYLISNTYQLDYFSEMVNKSEEYASSCYRLTNDIHYNTLNDYDNWGTDFRTNEENSPENVWTPAGNDNIPFTGTFDGNGHSIVGLYTFANTRNIGFIGVAENVTVKNLGIEKSIFITSEKTAGGIIAKLTTNTKSSIINTFTKDCYIKSSTRSGGLVGVVYTENPTDKTVIFNCYSDECCVAVTWEGEVGGLIALVYSNGPTIKIYNAFAFNNILKCYSSAVVEDCVNGSFVGRFYDENYDKCDIKNCLCSNDYYMYGNEYDEDMSDTFYGIVKIKGLRSVSDVDKTSGSYYYGFTDFIYDDDYKEFQRQPWNTDTLPPKLYFEGSYHKISYFVNGELYKEDYYKKGDEIIPPVLPALDKGEAIEWLYLPKTMQSFDIDINAETCTYGDVNDDGKINISDVTLIQKYLAGIVELELRSLVSSDFDYSGELDIADAKKLQRYTIGL